ncbi:MAG TPA: gliding motility-associated ABC transporter ATP-binding subunit GldA [Lunatimonas sp.]|nr:gliding motility-associated ABC transporter ATP-binding subunit GldA [Lunatimonas sp.]
MSIEVNNLSKLYGSQKALDGISFQAKPGQILGFLGPNGAGKSTAMKIATGFLLPDGGDVIIKGVSVTKHPLVVSKMVGYLPEHNPLYLDMYIPEFLSFMGGLYQLSGKELANNVSNVMEECGLMPEKTKKISQLSKGYRQRVGLAKTLVHDPEIIILDEPTTGLDPNQLVEIRNLIKTISLNKTLVLSTHIMQEVEAICEKVVIIHRGKIVAQDLLQNLTATEKGFTFVLATEEILDAEWFSSVSLIDLKVLSANRFLIRTADPHLFRKQVLHLIHERQLNLVELKQETKNLEAVFHQLTQASV